jgi:hypothetical protein
MLDPAFDLVGAEFLELSGVFNLADSCQRCGFTLLYAEPYR